MTAIELMDAKLDGTCHRPRLVPIATRLLDGSLPLASLCAGDVVRVMDKLLQLEVCASVRCEGAVLCEVALWAERGLCLPHTAATLPLRRCPGCAATPFRRP